MVVDILARAPAVGADENACTTKVAFSGLIHIPFDKITLHNRGYSQFAKMGSYICTICR